jgi:MFS family permease
MSMPLAHIVAHTSDLGHATSRAAEMLSVLLAATLIVRLLAGSFILDRFGGLLSLLIFSALQALALTFYAAVDGLLALYAVSLMFGLGYGGIGMCYPIIVREYLPASQAGRRLGLVNLFGAGGMALGGWLAGVVFDLQGTYSPAFMVGVAFNVANIAIILVLLARRGRSRLQPFAARA